MWLTGPKEQELLPVTGDPAPLGLDDDTVGQDEVWSVCPVLGWLYKRDAEWLVLGLDISRPKPSHNLLFQTAAVTFDQSTIRSRRDLQPPCIPQPQLQVH